MWCCLWTNQWPSIFIAFFPKADCPDSKYVKKLIIFYALFCPPNPNNLFIHWWVPLFRSSKILQCITDWSKSSTYLTQQIHLTDWKTNSTQSLCNISSLQIYFAYSNTSESHKSVKCYKRTKCTYLFYFLISTSQGIWSLMPCT